MLQEKRSYVPTGAHRLDYDPVVGRCHALVYALMWFVTQRSTSREFLCLSRAAFRKVLRDTWRILRGFCVNASRHEKHWMLTKSRAEDISFIDFNCPMSENP